MFHHTSVGKTNAFLWNECRTNVLIIQHLGRISGRRNLISVLSSVFERNLNTPSLKVDEDLAYKLPGSFLLCVTYTVKLVAWWRSLLPISSSFMCPLPIHLGGCFPDTVLLGDQQLVLNTCVSALWSEPQLWDQIESESVIHSVVSDSWQPRGL